MRTALQLRLVEPICELVHGTPLRIAPSSRGSIAVVDPDEIVAYRIEHAGTERLFLFRTLDRDEPGSTGLPGVHPRVRLLAVFSKSRDINRMRRLFSCLLRHGWTPSLLTDEFWLRAAHLLAGHKPRQKLLGDCLRFAATDSGIGSVELITRRFLAS